MAYVPSSSHCIYEQEYYTDMAHDMSSNATPTTQPTLVFPVVMAPNGGHTDLGIGTVGAGAFRAVVLNHDDLHLFLNPLIARVSGGGTLSSSEVTQLLWLAARDPCCAGSTQAVRDVVDGSGANN